MNLRHGRNNCRAPEGVLSTIHRTSSPCVVTISTEISQLQILDAFFLEVGWRGLLVFPVLSPFLHGIGLSLETVWHQPANVSSATATNLLVSV